MTFDPEDIGSNPSTNEHFETVADRALSRRSFLSLGAGAASIVAFTPILSACGAGGSSAGSDAGATVQPLSFGAVPVTTADTIVVPAEYKWQLVYAWGDPINGVSPAFKQDGSNTAAEQAAQAGMHHDGGIFFPLPGWKSSSSTSGLWAVNHEYIDPSLLIQGGAPNYATAEGVAKAKAAHGVSIVELAQSAAGTWSLVKYSPYARRITADTEMEIRGPARGDARMKTSGDSTGTLVRGTLNNCAAGFTPWGTYLTCEENFNGYFGTDSGGFVQSNDQKRYGLVGTGFTFTPPGGAATPIYPWWKQDTRFDLSTEPNESNRHGYIVEIDPYEPTRGPVKRTAMGRYKHENCEWQLAKDGRVAFYSGDDERNEYIYKFVTRYRYDPSNREVNRNLLDEGTLYVAKFNDDGTGQWLELSVGQNGLTPANGWNTAADIAIRTRQAADRAGATMMDRPEWVAVNRSTGDVYVTLTNNNRRGTTPASSNAVDGTTSGGSARPAINAVNPRANNVYGHIVRWQEDGNDAAAVTFKWSIFVLAGDAQQTDATKKGNINGDAFGSPDGLWVDEGGLLWIQTDVSTGVLFNQNPTAPNADYRNLGNNQMLVADPVTRQVKRFLTGPAQCEITGAYMTPDRKTLFINIQHPGEDGGDADLSATPKKFSSWPDGASGGRPRSATIAIQRRDGGIVGY